MKEVKFYLFFCFAIAAGKELLVFTPSYSRADFIEWQYKTLKKFVIGPYRFLVFNDATDEEKKKDITNKCLKLGVECISVPQIVHSLPILPRRAGEDLNSPAIRNANVIQLFLNSVGLIYDGPVLLLDSDMFLIREFDYEKILKSGDCFFLSQAYANSKGEFFEYFWQGLVLMNMPKLTNKQSISFNPCFINEAPLDCGGATYYYLINNPEVKFVNFGMIRVDDILKNNFYEGFTEDERCLLIPDLRDLEFHFDCMFLHYHAGSNWDFKTEEFHKFKTEKIKRFIYAITS